MIGKHENDCPAKSVQSKFKNKQKKYFWDYVFFENSGRREKTYEYQIAYLLMRNSFNFDLNVAIVVASWI